MGQVWQATDTQLNRQVALKILPDAFAADPDRLARFTREAQILARLNHPNIAAISGIEESEGTRALVLELVEGPTLADRISKGPIPLDEALPIAKQIAEALEAAHEAGVTLRRRRVPPEEIRHRHLPDRSRRQGLRFRGPSRRSQLRRRWRLAYRWHLGQANSQRRGTTFSSQSAAPALPPNLRSRPTVGRWCSSRVGPRRNVACGCGRSIRRGSCSRATAFVSVMASACPVGQRISMRFRVVRTPSCMLTAVHILRPAS